MKCSYVQENIGNQGTPTFAQALNTYNLPFNDLLFAAQKIHRENFNPNEIQVSTLLNIKKGGCPEKCNYCSQSAHFNTGLKKEPLMDVDKVLEAAQRAKDTGATRFCMVAAWRGVHDRDMGKITEMVQKVKAMGLETCLSGGLLEPRHAEGGVGFVHGAIGFHAQVEFRTTLAGAKRGVAVIAGAGIDAVEHDHDEFLFIRVSRARP